jgi:hypothetical protein
MNQWQARETEKRDARVCIAVYKGRIGGESPLEQLGGKLEIRKDDDERGKVRVKERIVTKLI